MELLMVSPSGNSDRPLIPEIAIAQFSLKKRSPVYLQKSDIPEKASAHLSTKKRSLISSKGDRPSIS